MSTLLRRWFLDHPHSVNETYLQHLAFATGFGLTLIGAGLAALTHAVVPVLHERTASTTVRRLHARIAGRGPSPAPVAQTDQQDWCPQI